MAKNKKSKNKDYSQLFKAIKPFVKLNIPHNKKNFTRQEKWYISRYSTILIGDGLIKEEGGTYHQTVKFQKGKSSTTKGAPKLKGRFIQGAKPSDKVIGGIIQKDNYSKTFIKLDFSGSEEIDPDQLYDFVYEILSIGLMPFWDKIQKADYFSIVVSNGWEIKLGNPDALKYTDGLTKGRKLEELAKQITKLLKKSIEKYEIKGMLISGIYIWKFKNQRKKMTKKESKIVKGKKKNKKR